MKRIKGRTQIKPSCSTTLPHQSRHHRPLLWDSEAGKAGLLSSPRGSHGGGCCTWAHERWAPGLHLNHPKGVLSLIQAGWTEWHLCVDSPSVQDSQSASQDHDNICGQHPQVPTALTASQAGDPSSGRGTRGWCPPLGLQASAFLQKSCHMSTEYFTASEIL